MPLARGKKGRPQSCTVCLCRYEAAQLPDTMISELNTAQYDERRTSYVDTHSTPSIEFQNLRPEWIRGFVNDFAQLRSNLDRCRDPCIC